MKIFISYFLILLSMAVSCAAHAESGKYVSWSVEEHDGWRWKELFVDRDYSRDMDHRELEKVWRDYPSCTTSREEELRREHRINVPAIIDDVASESRYEIKPSLGRKYRIKVRNNTSCRMSVTVEIDGINSIGSRSVSGRSSDQGWVLGGDDYIYVKGFQEGNREAREFYWSTPADAHSYKDNELGNIRIYVYFEDSKCALDLLTEPCNCGRTSARGGGGGGSHSPSTATGAGQYVSNPVHNVNFNDLTRDPLEVITIDYSKARRSWYESHNSNHEYDDRDKKEKKDFGRDDRHDDYPPRDNHDNNSGYSARHSSECYNGTGVRIDKADFQGVVVVDVIHGGPAWNAGIRPGVVITKADGDYIDSTSQLASIVRNKHRRDILRLTYIQDDVYITKNIYLDYVCWN